MTNLQKLISLLCEVKEIKKDIMELRSGTKIIFKDYFGKKRIILGSDIHYNYFSRNHIEEIGNPIEYHHLIMYCYNKKIRLQIHRNKNTLPLHKQSEEVLGQLVDYLSNIK